ncbi:Fe-S cluster assembly protein SufD [Acuticoccus sediminis]|uniref:Fe-S cluster assembly protein SufD n=1 Tax=Acuticoccus sediminis TaxID=2184697 RepID=UPI001CFF424F|nr:Fe-S cluster assembly protein SufD [Acuticoccus sediminis]
MGELVTTQSLLGAAPIDGGGWAAAFRASGRETFQRLGIPHRRVESFRYSDLYATLQRKAPEAEPATEPLALEGSAVLTVRDGTVRGALPAGAALLSDAMAEATSPAAPLVGRINAAEQSGHPVAALNAAKADEGLVLTVRADAIAPTLHLDFDWTDGEQRHLRLVVVVEAGASFTVTETHRGNPGLATVVTEFRLAEGARLAHLRIDRLGAAARLSTALFGEVGAGAAYEAFTLSEGGDFCRAEALVALTGEAAHVALDGALLTGGARHVDVTAVLTHAAPSTTSRQSFRAVLGGKANAAYQGAIKVSPGAQKTDAYQMSRALLLSPRAFIATKPELEIYADDVKCSHGAATGALSEDALFFLRTRGLTGAEARALLVEAFVNEALEAIPDPALRDLATSAALEWMQTHAGEVSHA